MLFGRFENLRADALRLFEPAGAPITNGIAGSLALEPFRNASPRLEDFMAAYGPAPKRLVAAMGRSLIERFVREFSE
ncbi:MAG: hypothetical protein OXF72_02850 [Gammaproteobacteria bacterium]|nr:hypothetical protein [Gammaproteobacteria bacterium]MCY4322963.1 hypothetical protein [Gammaproteobacteria bacterium]